MSGFIEIDKPPVIFDDAECCNSASEQCKFLSSHGVLACCDQFDDSDWLERSGWKVLKNSECKAAWKKAKEKE